MKQPLNSEHLLSKILITSRAHLPNSLAHQTSLMAAEFYTNTAARHDPSVELRPPSIPRNSVDFIIWQQNSHPRKHGSRPKPDWCSWGSCGGNTAQPEAGRSHHSRHASNYLPISRTLKNSKRKSHFHQFLCSNWPWKQHRILVVSWERLHLTKYIETLSGWRWRKTQ